MAVNTRAYIEKYLKIRDKNARIVPFIINYPQMKLYDALAAQYVAGKPMRAIILKARQMGFSTLTEGMIFKRTATKRNVKSGIITHKSDATRNLYNMSRLFYKELPQELKPQITNSNAQELIFDRKEGGGLGSSIKCMTAGGDGVGRSDTFQNLHISEFAWWTGDKEGTLTGLLQAVPDAIDTMVIIESTANGFDAFKKRWDAAVSGESGFVAVFCGWHEMAEYRREYDGFAFTADEEQLKAQYGLDNEQIAWRRWCISTNCGGDLNLFKQEYPICPQEAFIASGDCIFDKEAIINQMQLAPEPIKTGNMCYKTHGSEEEGYFWLDGFYFGEDKRGAIKMYKPPEAGVPYVIGCDTAGDGSDWFVADVLDNRTGEQVAILRQKFDETLFALQIMALGYYYNAALLAVETNFSTHPIRVCERYNYPRLYTRETMDTYTHKMQKKHGVNTNGSTRPVMIAQLVDFARDYIHYIYSADTLNEMLTFVKNERGRAEAIEGEHDDCVMARCLALFARSQQSCIKTVVDDVDERFNSDDLDDFLGFGEEF